MIVLANRGGENNLRWRFRIEERIAVNAGNCRRPPRVENA